MGSGKKGTYYRWHPADAAILKLLPADGSAIGYHPIAATVAQMLIDLNRDVPEQGRLTTDELVARLRSMLAAGMTVQVALTGSRGSVGWQRTRRGEIVYAENTGERLGGPPELQPIEGGRER